jgi:hypothetical protein
VKAATLTQFSPTSHFTENRKENKTFEAADTPQTDNENNIGWTLMQNSKIWEFRFFFSAKKER